MEEAKTSFQKALCPGQNKVQIKKIVKRKEDIVVETNTNEALEKLQNLTDCDLLLKNRYMNFLTLAITLFVLL